MVTGTNIQKQHDDILKKEGLLKHLDNVNIALFSVMFTMLLSVQANWLEKSKIARMLQAIALFGLFICILDVIYACIRDNIENDKKVLIARNNAVDGNNNKIEVKFQAECSLERNIRYFGLGASLIYLIGELLEAIDAFHSFGFYSTDKIPISLGSLNLVFAATLGMIASVLGVVKYFNNKSKSKEGDNQHSDFKVILPLIVGFAASFIGLISKAIGCLDDLKSKASIQASVSMLVVMAMLLLIPVAERVGEKLDEYEAVKITDQIKNKA